jgi:hypothetical protein
MMTREQVRARLIELGQENPSDSLIKGWFNIVNDCTLIDVSAANFRHAKAKETSEFDRRLQAAVATNADPAVVSPSGVAFAWFPVWGWDYVARRHRRLWWEKIIWFAPLGLLIEYSTYAGSEREFHAKHGRYSWESP